ncbi:hypothetical protein DV737_g131, partial [Chaetothyriales sp. CBS 132003]
MSQEAPRKRSRFDQTEPEPRKTSRFDRRSRSPSTRQAEPRRSRSPVASQSPPIHESRRVPNQDPAAAAAAAAAKINADLRARNGVQHVDVPPIRSVSIARRVCAAFGHLLTLCQPAVATPTPPPSSSSAPKITTGQSMSKLDGDIYIADGDYIKDIEVNDLRNRYTLTKGSTQKMIKEETGADITTRGSYYPDKSLATATNPPLYLHVTSTSRSGLEKAIAKIEELMKQELPNLVDERRFRRRDQDTVERDEFGRRKWPEERIPLEMENVPGFNLRAQVVGQGGAYVKHIQQESGCKVQIKGRGSGFMEHSTGQESEEPMFLHVTAPQPQQVQKGKELCEDLLASVRQNYEHFKANPPAQRPESYTDGYGADAHRNPYSAYAPRSGSYNSPYPQSHTPTAPAPGTSLQPAQPAQSTAQPAQSAADYYAQYYANQPGGDPYAAYGGYANYVQYYQAYYSQQQAQQAQQAPPPPADGYGQQQTSPPPPPPPPGL